MFGAIEDRAANGGSGKFARESEGREGFGRVDEAPNGTSNKPSEELGIVLIEANVPRANSSEDCKPLPFRLSDTLSDGVARSTAVGLPNVLYVFDLAVENPLGIDADFCEKGEIIDLL